MSRFHADQIRDFKTEIDELADSYLGHVFDRNNVLVGYIDDTGESVIALTLLQYNLCDEVRPEDESEISFGCYCRMRDRLQQLGYKVIDAEWWRKKDEPSYSIEALPEEGDG